MIVVDEDISEKGVVLQGGCVVLHWDQTHLSIKEGADSLAMWNEPDLSIEDPLIQNQQAGEKTALTHRQRDKIHHSENSLRFQ